MSWQERFDNMDFSAYRDSNALMKKYMTPKASEAGICGPTGSGIFIRDNGAIEIFAKEGLGISIDPNFDSISLFASKINLNGSEIDVYTDPMKWRWNKFPLNLKPMFSGEAVVEGSILPIPEIPQAVAQYVKNIIERMK